MIILDDHKLNYHLDRVQAWLNGERIAPITMDIALTRACTYNCIYCYSKLQKNKSKVLTWNVIKRFLDDAREIGVKAISLVSDGESTCSPHVYNTILYGKEIGLDMALGTNGYLLKDDRLIEILPKLSYIRFNVSAATPKWYAKIHGCDEKCYHKVVGTIKKCVAIKKKHKLNVTIGMQMVLHPDYIHDIIPLCELGRDLGIDYFIIKHCSDDEDGSLEVDYSKYLYIKDILKDAESFTMGDYQVSVKWSKILDGRNRTYSHCYGPPFIMQLSGSGLVAPCGMLFNERYAKYHIGNIVDTSFKELWKGERYWKVMKMLAEDHNVYKCGSLCLQHNVNQFLDGLRKIPKHVNFV